MEFPTMWYVRPAKPQISLRIHVLLNLINEFTFCNKFNKFNNTGARMLDFIYHMAIELLKNCIYGVKMSRFCHILCNIKMNVIT